MISSLISKGFLRSFQVRDFRLLWLSDGFGSWAEHTEFVVLAWYVLTVTDSPFMVGVFGALRFVGTLFAPFYGVLADRYDRARLFALVRTSALAIAGVVLALAVAGQLNVWFVFVLMTMEGIARAAYIVTRQALVADQLQGERLMNGVALNRIAFNVAQLGGPAIGGVLLSRMGTIWAYVPVVVFNLLASLLALCDASHGQRDFGLATVDVEQPGRSVQLHRQASGRTGAASHGFSGEPHRLPPEPRPHACLRARCSWPGARRDSRRFWLSTPQVR